MAQAQTMIAAPRVTITEAAQMLGVTQDAVRKLVERGDLKRVNIPIRIKAFVLRSSVEELIAHMQGDERQAG